MKINKAYKFRLEPNADQEVVLNNLVGCARFVWNQMLALSFEMFARNEHINAVNLVNKITALKKNPEYAFLALHSNAVSLQQKVRDLASAWVKFFDTKEHARLKENKRKPKKPKFFKLNDGTEIQLRPLMPRFKKNQTVMIRFGLFNSINTVGLKAINLSFLTVSVLLNLENHKTF